MLTIFKPRDLQKYQELGTMGVASASKPMHNTTYVSPGVT